jgi:hypothetical protein
VRRESSDYMIFALAGPSFGSDYRGNFIISGSEKSSVNGLHRFSYKSSDYRGKFHIDGNVRRKKFGITGSSVYRGSV